MNIIHLATITSTNDYAKKNYKKLKHGTVIIADEQTTGRGRRNNKWFSPKGKGLYFSILFKKISCNAQLLNIIPAYAVLETLYKLYGIKAHIKWPNDILIKGKKIGGILVELKYIGKKLIYAVIGIGLNLKGKPSDFPLNLRASSAFIF